MIHVTAAIGLGLAALLEAIFWSVAPSAVGVIAVAGVILLVVLKLSRRRRDRAGRRQG